MEKDQKHLKIYKSFLFEAIQKVPSIYHSLNNTKHQFDSCLNHLTRPVLLIEKPSTISDQPERKVELKEGFSHKIFIFSSIIN